MPAAPLKAGTLTELEPRDRAAMQAAIELAKADPELRDFIEALLQDRGEQGAGEWASGFYQVKFLRLKPWECNPIGTQNVEQTSDNYGCRPGEVELLRKMFSLGISRYEPDPLKAIARAERERAA